MVNPAGPRALVLVRRPRGAPGPDAAEVRQALVDDRTRIATVGGASFGYRLAGPYPVVVDGVEMDEYVAWEA
jgi:hypothetical protein